MWCTIEYALPGCGVLWSRGLRPTRVWRTLEYATTNEECTLESKSCLESVAAPKPVCRSVCYTPQDIRLINIKSKVEEGRVTGESFLSPPYPNLSISYPKSTECFNACNIVRNQKK